MLVYFGIGLQAVARTQVFKQVVDYAVADFEKFVLRTLGGMLVLYLAIRFFVVPVLKVWFRVTVYCGVGLRVLAVSFLRLVYFLASPAQRLYVNHRLRRKVMHLVRAPDMGTVALTGTLAYDCNGPYILIMVNGSERQVRIASSDLACLSMASAAAASRGAESLLPGAVMVPSSLPGGQVFLRVGKKTVGAGFRTRHFSDEDGPYDALVTAYHVGLALAKTGADWSMATESAEIPLDAELRSRMVITKWSTDLDLVVIKTPVHLFAPLGVKCLKLAKTPLGPAVNISGVSQGDLYKSIGVVTKATSMFAFKHSVSTERGWSGSPILNESGAVVGMHTRGFGRRPEGHVGPWSPHNVGVSFDWAISARSPTRGAESDINVYAFAHREDIDDDDRRITLHEEMADRWMDTHDNGYGDWYGESHDWRGESFTGFRWSDEDMDFDASPFEAAYDAGFRIAPVDNTGAVSSAATASKKAEVTVLSVGPTASSSTPSAPTPGVATPSVAPPPSPPKKSRRKSRKSKDVAGPVLRGRESTDPSVSTPGGTSLGNLPQPATPTVTTTVTASPQPGSNALSEQLQQQLALLVPLAGTMSQSDLRSVVCSLPSGKENLTGAISWLSARMQRNAARVLKKSSASSARSSQ